MLAIVGPTASGKTEYALRLAKERDGEIISVDSRQVYRFLNVGTAKPFGKWTSNEQRAMSKNGSVHSTLTAHRSLLYLVDGIPYHLVDIWDPAQAFSAADFVQLANDKVQDITRRGKKPIFVGGTGLYLKAYFEGLAPLPPRNETLRHELHRQAEKKGRAFLHSQLEQVDPVSAVKIPANNIARVIRALEVYRLTGKPISQWHSEHRVARRSKGELPITCVGLAIPLAELHRCIETRCHWMLSHGMIEETQALLKKGYSPTCPALTGLGYPRVLAFLQNKLSRAELLRLLIQDTRQYAKRQMTWLRHQLQVEWIEVL
jgi:tRNA dimethylallyltransferase